MSRCVNGQGYMENHAAEGWIVSPEGRRISPMCARQAQEAIDEYAAKLGEIWTFKHETSADSDECRHIERTL